MPEFVKLKRTGAGIYASINGMDYAFMTEYGINGGNVVLTKKLPKDIEDLERVRKCTDALLNHKIKITKMEKGRRYEEKV